MLKTVTSRALLVAVAIASVAELKRKETANLKPDIDVIIAKWSPDVSLSCSARNSVTQKSDHSSCPAASGRWSAWWRFLPSTGAPFTWSFAAFAALPILDSKRDDAIWMIWLGTIDVYLPFAISGMSCQAKSPFSYLLLKPPWLTRLFVEILHKKSNHPPLNVCRNFT